MPSDRRVIFVRPSQRVCDELDRLSAEFGVSRSAAVALLLERRVGDLAVVLAKPVGGRPVRRSYEGSLSAGISCSV